MQIGRVCDAQELAAFRRYQSSTSNTWQFVQDVLNAGVPLLKAAAVGTGAIGDLQTFFKHIGRTTAQSRCGMLRFRVAQVIQLFDDPDLVTGDPELALMRQTVHRYTELFDSEASAPRVTILVAADISILLDGNKTTLAAYLHSQRASQTDYVLEMYCLNATHIPFSHLFV